MKELDEALDRYVRPALDLHGGGLKVLGYEDGILRFKMLGSCAGCSAADLTTEQVIDEELKKHVPGFQKAVLVTEVSEDLLVQARAILHKGTGD